MEAYGSHVTDSEVHLPNMTPEQGLLCQSSAPVSLPAVFSWKGMGDFLFPYILWATNNV